MKKRKANYKKVPHWDLNERRIGGIFSILIQFILIIGLIAEGFKEWMILTFLGNIGITYFLFKQDKLIGVGS